jgi:hypothetical protein
MSAPVWLIFVVLAIQVGVTVYQFRWYRVLRGAAEDAMAVYARIRDLEQRDRRVHPSPWSQADHLRTPVPSYGDHQPRHLQGDA